MRTSARERLREFRAPDEAASERRAWDVVRSAYLDREPAPVIRRFRRPLALAPLAAILAAGLLLSPAGATVKRLISHALGIRHAAPTLSSLPSSGRILVSGPGGTWTAAADGSIRHLGAWQQASWSPHGLFVVVSSGDRLAAVDPRGNVRWALARPRISDATWFSPTGYRIAYLSAGTLRVVAGDGTGDHLLAARVARVAPAWRPGHPYQLAYVTDRGTVVVRDADSGELLWSVAPGAAPRELLWSNDGSRLVVLSAHLARTYGADARPRARLALPRGESATDAALSPDGATLALVLDADQVVVARTNSRTPRLRQVLAGAGVRDVSWSPDGRWLLVSWPAANQWVFARVIGAPHMTAVSRIAQQFSAAGSARAFPQLEGWCCTAQGSSG
jgi:WD40 repeat protein